LRDTTRRFTCHSVAWFEITGKDGEALQRFYGEVFGWEYP
jgi:predicted enzyme related to lactoylglutathione lyase